jgi:hypothetical protein
MPLGMLGPRLWLDRLERRPDVRDAASICLLVYWCMNRAYDVISDGGEYEAGMKFSLEDMVEIVIGNVIGIEKRLWMVLLRMVAVTC